MNKYRREQQQQQQQIDRETWPNKMSAKELYVNRNGNKCETH